jgi:hypothetical protein
LHWSFIIAAHCIKLAITQFLTQFVELFGLEPTIPSKAARRGLRRPKHLFGHDRELQIPLHV